MASVWKHPRSPYWFAGFVDARGRRLCRSTKQRTRRKALETAVTWEKAGWDGRNGALSEAQARRVVSELVKQAAGEALHFHTCRAWLEEWLAGKHGSAGDRTVEKYRQIIKDFLKHLRDRANLALVAISPKDIREYRDALAAGGRAASTVNNAVKKTLNVPFAAALRLGYLEVNPVAAVEALTTPRESGRDVFTVDQVRTLVEKTSGDWQGAILAGFYTGLRLGDIMSLLWENLDLTERVLRMTTRKTGAKVVIPLHPELANWLDRATRGIGKAPVFPELFGKKTGGYSGLSAQFGKLMDDAGIVRVMIRTGEGRGHKTSNLSFHCLRHSFVSALANAGVAPDLRQKLAGHADANSHARYTHHDLAAIRKAVDVLPALAM